jgi:2'-5' RNA ligase
VKRRYFFGLQPPEAVAKAMRHAWLQQPDANGRSHHWADLHMTLVFLGEREESPEQLSALVSLPDIPPFSLALDQFDYWSRPKVAVLRSESCPQPLGTLVESLLKNMIAAGVEVDTRPYKPHVTLARKARSIERVRLENPIEWRIDSFCLFLSDWSNGPPHYRVLNRWPLTGSVG